MMGDIAASALAWGLRWAAEAQAWAGGDWPKQAAQRDPLCKVKRLEGDEVVSLRLRNCASPLNCFMSQSSRWALVSQKARTCRLVVLPMTTCLMAMKDLCSRPCIMAVFSTWSAYSTHMNSRCAGSPGASFITISGDRLVTIAFTTSWTSFSANLSMPTCGGASSFGDPSPPTRCTSSSAALPFIPPSPSPW